MQSIKDILKNFNPLEDKYISRDFQAFGIYLAERLSEPRKKSLYIKLAKTIPRPVLEEALRFVIDSNARKKGALFMWKLKQLGIFDKNKNSKSVKNQSKSVKISD